MKVELLFKSKYFKFFLFGLAGFIIILCVFRLGVIVGFKKANFSFHWEENYPRNFLMPRPKNMAPFNMPWGDFPEDRFINAHGTSGQILKIEGNILMINGEDKVEKSILIKDDTIIRKFRDNISLKDLKVGENVVIIGVPNDSGQIEARLIRLFDNN